MIGRREEWCGFHCPLFWGPWTKDRKRHEYPGMTSLSLGGGSAIVVSGAKPSQKVKIIPTYIKTSAAHLFTSKTTDFVILITTSSYNNISLICDFIQIDKTKQKQKTWIKKDVCVLPTIKNNDSVCFASGERGVTVLFLYNLCWQGSKDLTSSLRIRNKKISPKTGSASIIRIEVTPFGERFHVLGQYRPRQL